MMPKTQAELEKSILADIEKTGFASELRAIDYLQNAGWFATHSPYFIDLDQHISREYDINAYRLSGDIDARFEVEFEIVAEVKKTDRPWIIFASDAKGEFTDWRYSTTRYENCATFVAHTNGGGTFQNLFDPARIETNGTRLDVKRIGKAFHEFDKKASDHSRIHEALVKVIKVTIAVMQKEGFHFAAEFNPKGQTRMAIVKPVVIVDGLLFESYRDKESNSIKVEQRGFIPVSMLYNSQGYHNAHLMSTIKPDIVTLDFLPDYLKLLDKWEQFIMDYCTTILKERRQSLSPSSG